MRCLLCGRELALLKKLTDSEFCSPEHRTEFYDNQQRLIIERLQGNALRLRAYRQKLDRQSALPPFAPFLHPTLDIPVSGPGYLQFLEFEPSELLLSPPGLETKDFARSKKTMGTPGILPDFPLPVFSRKARAVAISLEFLPPSPSRAILTNLSLFGTQNRVPAGAPISVRPQGVNAEHLRPFEAAAFRAGAFTAEPHVPGSGADVDANGVSLSRSMVGIPGPDPRMDSPALHGNLAPAHTESTAAVRPQEYSAGSQLPMVAKAFRFRPKGGIQDSGLSDSLPIDAVADALLSKPARPGFTPEAVSLVPGSVERPLSFLSDEPVQDAALPSMLAKEPDIAHGGASGAVSPQWKPSASGLAPVASANPFRMRPRGPVADSTLAAMHVAGTEAVASAGSPQKPAFVDTARDLAPSVLTRLFRSRPRGPLADQKVPALLAGSLEVESTVPAHSHPYLSVASGEFAPNLCQKLYHMRPRGGVQAADIRAFEHLEAQAEIAEQHPAISALPELESAEFTLRQAQTPLRMRPRGPVSNELTADLAQSAITAADFVLTPMHGTLPAELIGQCAPNALDHQFRMRPKAGVRDAHLAAFEQLDFNAVAFVERPALTLTLPDGILAECAPNHLDRPFRMRPRAGVMDHALAAFGRVATGPAEALVSPPVRADLPATEPAGRTPRTVQRPFHMRPRGPVSDQAISSFEHVDIGLPAAFSGETHPAVAGLAPAASCEPKFLDHLFHMRPRGPVASRNLTAFQRFTALPIELTASAMQWPASKAIPEPDYEPAFLDKLYKARPRAGVLDKAVRGYWAVDVGAIEIILPDIITPGMPPVLMRQAQMVFRERPLQMRPRGPKPGGTSNFEKIEPVAQDKKKVREASCMALPAGAIGTAVLPFLGRPQTELPAIAVAGALALQIPVSGPLPASLSAVHPATDVVSVRGIPPAFSNLFRPRPRNPKTTPFVLRLEPARLEETAVIALPSPHSLAAFVQLPKAPAMPAHNILPCSEVQPVAPLLKQSVVEFAETELTVETPLFQPAVAGSLRETARTAFWNDLKHRWFGGLFGKWNTLSRDMVWIGTSAALLFGVFVHSHFMAGPHKLSSNIERADIAGNPIPPIESVITENWPTIQRNIANHAAIDLEDDFTGGLNRWDGGPNWAKTWSYDQLGGVLTGSLAVLRDSVDMTDYHVEFSGSIGRSALGWAVRARDARNYYALQIVQTTSGPQPRFSIVRYAVVDGKEVRKKTTEIPLPADPKTVWRVVMDVKGQFYTLMVQDHVVDFWQDGRFHSGGVGFFSPAGEHARLHKVRVSYRDDALGKMFAMVAPETGKKN